jgi:hypothetical protein
MGQLDKDFDTDCYETRELAWELQQQHVDQQRIKLLLENGADLKGALKLAKIELRDILKKPSLKPLQLQRHLQVETV